jgi:hypothetical protein
MPEIAQERLPALQENGKALFQGLYQILSPRRAGIIAIALELPGSLALQSDVGTSLSDAFLNFLQLTRGHGKKHNGGAMEKFPAVRWGLGKNWSGVACREKMPSARERCASGLRCSNWTWRACRSPKWDAGSFGSNGHRSG